MTERVFTVRTGDDFGRAIAEIRRQRHLSQEQLAQAAGLERTRLAKLEAGLSTIVLDHLMRTLRRLGASVNISFEVGDAET